MASVQLKLGPADRGRRVSHDEFDEAAFKYQIIDGRVYESSEPDYVSNKSRLFVHSRRAATVPEPDIAACQNLPPNRRIKELR